MTTKNILPREAIDKIIGQELGTIRVRKRQRRVGHKNTLEINHQVSHPRGRNHAGREDLQVNNSVKTTLKSSHRDVIGQRYRYLIHSKNKKLIDESNKIYSALLAQERNDNAETIEYMRMLLKNR